MHYVIFMPCLSGPCPEVLHVMQGRAAISQILLGVSPQQQKRYVEHCSMSSDSFGSLPVFDAEGQLIRYEVVNSIYTSLQSGSRLHTLYGRKSCASHANAD